MSRTKFILLPLCALAIFGAAHKTQAKVSDWQKGFSVNPDTNTDFASANFTQSLANLKSTGANYVTLIIPYYQDSISSTTLYPGYNTPTDDALVAGIDTAHNLGLAVNLNIHLESGDQKWRAYINPTDRATWFANYGNVAAHYAAIGTLHKVEMLTLGAELIDMTSDNLNSTNTGNWVNLIANIRSIYPGLLTYDGNWGPSGWNDELDHIKFWDRLDFIGVSAYYHLASSTSYTMDNLLAAWNSVNQNQLGPLAHAYSRPLLFTEVGYRSVNGALTHPASWQLSGAVDLAEQSDGYQALFSYWNNYDYFRGVQFWDWKVNPNAGGNGDSGFTVQNKPAQKVMSNWFTDGFYQRINPTTPQTSSYLSDIRWVTATNGWGPVELDASNGEQASGDGHTLTINGKTYAKGLGVNAKSKIIYNIANCTQFDSDIGVDDEVATKGSVVFQVWSGPKKIYDSGLLTYADNAKSVSLDIAGVTSLALIVNDGGNGNGKDHADWAGAQITCNPTAAPPQPPSPSAPSGIIDLWWPTDGSIISGQQPLKALLENLDVSQYSMYWQVDSGALNPMTDSKADWPHKESLVNVSDWAPTGDNSHTLTFTAKDSSGAILAIKTVRVYVIIN